MVSYCPGISASQNGPQRAPEVSRQPPELRNSGAKGNFGAQSRRWDEAGMGTKSHEETWSESVFRYGNEFTVESVAKLQKGALPERIHNQ